LPQDREIPSVHMDWLGRAEILTATPAIESMSNQLS